MQWLQRFSDLLGIPVDFVLRILGLELGEAWYVLAKIFVFVLLLYVFSKTTRFLARLIRPIFNKESLLTPEEKEAIEMMMGDSPHRGDAVAPLYAMPEEDTTAIPTSPAAFLESRGDFLRAAKLYLSEGNLQKTAECYAKAGNRKKAASLYIKQKDYKLAADMFFLEKNYRKAAQWYEKANDYKSAAECHLQRKRYKDALKNYLVYFNSSSGAPNDRFESAQKCLEILQIPQATQKVPLEIQRELKTTIAREFERFRKFAIAASLYREAADFGKAAEMFVQAGDLASAQDCYRKAGKEKEATLAAAKHFESQQEWREAGIAFYNAGAFLHAGNCFAKANLMADAAKAFEQAGAHYRAALAYYQLRKFEDAIRCLQRIRESDPDFNASRALLGRVFFDMHDYAHCAATLSNHLTGMRVETGNIEYFYMLALAYEQMGNLEQSRDLLLKIHSVNTVYRDVTTRLSNVSSRISMGQDRTLVQPTEQSVPVGDQSLETIQRQIGPRYRLEKELGRGGMGVVYMAYDTQLERRIALKFLGGLLEQSPEFHERFLREAKAAAKLNHPNIISIFDIGGTKGRIYIAMEYVEGGSLHRYLQAKGKLSPRETISIFTQVCSALMAIHDAQIVHRDIKPENILIAKGGLVKLTDFGLAKIGDSRVTRTGAVMGTPCYMAPEQVLGKETDPRTDIYATGLVMYQCLTGTLAFDGEDVLEKQLNYTPPSPRSLVPEIPENLDKIVMKCIEKDPQSRYSSARDLLSDLKQG